MRILCVDYGGKRIGLAVSDPLGVTAQPLKLIERGNEKAVKPVIKEIARVVDELGVGVIVVGRPVALDGGLGQFETRAADFAERLKRRFPALEVKMWDERFSSAAAERSLKEFGFDGKERRRRIDETAAALILQSYMERLLKGENILNETFDGSDEFDEFDEEMEVETITLTDENGEELECLVLDSVEYKGSTYLLIIEADEMDDEDAEAGILKEVAQDGDDFTYQFIEDDDEFEAVSELFEEHGDEFIIEE